MFSNYRHLKSVILSLALSACQSPYLSIACENTLTAETATKDQSNPSLKPPSSSLVASQILISQTSIPAQYLISTDGIGLARIGMTYGQLKAKLGKNTKFQIKTHFQVDIDAIAVRQSEQVQYYILYPAGNRFKDSDVIEILMTNNPQYRTSKNIGIGTSLIEAQKVYGQAALYYNTSNESREYVRFAKQPAKNIYFRPGSKSQGLVGIYHSSSKEYQETSRFQNGAFIRSVEVVSQKRK